MHNTQKIMFMYIIGLYSWKDRAFWGVVHVIKSTCMWHRTNYLL